MYPSTVVRGYPNAGVVELEQLLTYQLGRRGANPATTITFTNGSGDIEHGWTIIRFSLPVANFASNPLQTIAIAAHVNADLDGHDYDYRPLFLVRMENATSTHGPTSNVLTNNIVVPCNLSNCASPNFCDGPFTCRAPPPPVTPTAVCDDDLATGFDHAYVSDATNFEFLSPTIRFFFFF